ncbi:hypothetical protein [Hoylesella saccharolytica]|jgi:hypothetical protein|uniref:hypothetical protein n=1 Tax=Hoylesella saccharolytica TaxID=633701 RepID=UPI0028EC4A96|nr:hypothetical protein [Hoylesella saccharolytica]
MKTKCYSVRLKSLASISAKAYKATAFDGSTAIIPKSQVIAPDFGVSKSDAYWIAAWFLEKTELQYSGKKEAWFDERGAMLPSFSVKKHVPEKVKPEGNNIIKSLQR